LTNKFFNTNI